jgi:hypothetical protein
MPEKYRSNAQARRERKTPHPQRKRNVAEVRGSKAWPKT